MIHVVMFSGGIGSWAAARRVRQRHPTEKILALFADTKMEDEDLYRFLPEAAASVRADLVMIAEGRTPWQVFRDERFLGNSRVDPCSKILKRRALDTWRDENLDPKETIVYVGIDWTEEHRFHRVRERLGAWRVEAPMCEAPFVTKVEMLEDLASFGIEPPRLYAMGFSHNNCGGFCIKAGHAHFANLLRALPERYAFHEQQEQELREQLGDVSILKDRAGGGPPKRLTLRAFRERLQCGEPYDKLDLGGCGCFAGSDTQA